MYQTNTYIISHFTGMVKQGEVIERLQEQVISTQHEYLGRDYQLYKVVFHEEKDTPKRNGLLNGHTGDSNFYW